MSPEKQRLSLPELMAMTDEELNRLSAECDGWKWQTVWCGIDNSSRPMLLHPQKSIHDTHPDYCESRDVAFSLRKDFTDEQHFHYLFHLGEIVFPGRQISSSYDTLLASQRKMHDASARQQTIAAVMVLQNEENK